MEYAVKSGTPEKQRIDCVVVAIYASRKLSPSATIIDTASNGYISSLLKRGEIEGEPGDTLLLYNVENTLCDRILLVGCGKEENISVKSFYKINNAMVKCLQASGTTKIASYLCEAPVKNKDINWNIQHSITAIEETLYKFSQLKSSKKKTPRLQLRKCIFNIASRAQLKAAEQAVQQGIAISSGIHLAKDLGNLPGNICTPSYLARQAKKLARQHRQIKTTVLEEADMKKLGMGSLLSVSQGSREAAKLITMKYMAGDKKQAPIVLVGKGVTFDSGGISLKPGAAMDEMKYDMCGAASVIGVMNAIAEMQLAVNVIGVVPTVENMPDGLASRPGDIVTSMSGQTIEILNTDAEGRLILCDALTYVEKFKPDVVIDIATLTGACIVALGAHPAGLLSNHEPLAADLLSAGQSSGDRCWQLPLWDDYQQQLDSNFADMANIGGKGAGTITAACFLSRFTKKYNWAHLDVAGVAWKSGAQKGATGRPVGLLTQYIRDRIA